MNNIFRLKGQMHRLVNLIFYGFIFILGFLLGGGKVEKIPSFFNFFN